MPSPHSSRHTNTRRTRPTTLALTEPCASCSPSKRTSSPSSSPDISCTRTPSHPPTEHSTHEPIATAYSVTRFHPRQTVVLVPDTHHGRSLAIARHASNVSTGHSIRIHLLSLSLTDTHRHSCGLSQQNIQVDNIPSTSLIVLASSHQVTKSPSHQVAEEHVLVAIAVCHRRQVHNIATLSTRPRQDTPTTPSP